MHSYAQNCCYEANWVNCNLALLGTDCRMSIPGGARKSGSLGISERSLQRKGQMQLLVENKPVNTFTKQQRLTDSGLIAFAVRERMVYKKCNGGHQ